MAARKQVVMTPEQLAEKLFGYMEGFTKPDLDQEKVAELMDNSFGTMVAIKQLDRQLKIATVWKLSQLGAFPLGVALFVPNSVTYSLTATLLGIALEDEDLLSHKIGKSLVREERFLIAAQEGLKPTAETAHLCLLVAQMMNNILKSASPDMVVAVCSHGQFLDMFAAVLKQTGADLPSMDWRFPFIVTEMLLIMELTADCHSRLDKAEIGKLAVNLVCSVSEKDCSPVGKALLEKGHLLHRAVNIAGLWLLRQTDRDGDMVKALAESTLFVIKHQAAMNKPPPKNQIPVTVVGQAIVAAAGGDNSPLEKIKEALLGKKLDWESIEKSAETKVRSSDFMEEVKNQELKIKAEQEAEGDSDDEEHDKAAAAAAAATAGSVPSFIESNFTSRVGYDEWVATQAS